MLQTATHRQNRLLVPPVRLYNTSRRQQGAFRWQHAVLVAVLLFVAAVGTASANDVSATDPVYAGVSTGQQVQPGGTTDTQAVPAAAVQPQGPAGTVPGSVFPPNIAVAPGTVAQVAATGVPDRCIISGSALFSSCAREIGAAQNRFNLTVDVAAPQNYSQLLAERGVTRGQAIDALREILAEPDESCCNASCTFNQLLLCDCEPSVLEVAIRFAGADAAFYALLAEQLAYGCHQKIYFGDTCPADIAAVLKANGVIEGGGVSRAVCVRTTDSNDGAVPRSTAAMPTGSYWDGYGAGYAACLQAAGEYGSSIPGGYGGYSSSSQGQQISGDGAHSGRSSSGQESTTTSTTGN